METINSNAEVYYKLTPGQLQEIILEAIDKYMAMHQASPPVEDRHLNTQEAAKFLGKSIPTLNRWRATKYLPCDGYVGRQPWYSEAKLLEFMKGGKN